jgi:hypothetical protein
MHVCGIFSLRRVARRKEVVDLVPYWGEGRLIGFPIRVVSDLLRKSFDWSVDPRSIRNLLIEWNQVDLTARQIRLEEEQTKGDEGRIVPLSSELVDMLRQVEQVKASASIRRNESLQGMD